MTAENYRAYAYTEALKDGINPDEFVQTLECESQFNPTAIGDHGTSIGIAQIHLPAHPEVARATAKIGTWAIEWAAKQFQQGNQRIWTCYRKLFG